jgi:hypothetical protein
MRQILSYLPSRSRTCALICIFVILSLSCEGFVLQSRVISVTPATRRCWMSTPAAVTVAPYIPDLRAPSDLFNNVVNIGATKAKLTPMKTFLLGIKSGCHISFGKLMLSEILNEPLRWIISLCYCTCRCALNAFSGRVLSCTSDVKQSWII